MKIYNIKNFALAMAVAGFASSCNDFLDELPDNRMELTTAQEASKLLVSAYPDVSSAYLLETFSDNTDKNIGSGWAAYDMLQTEMFEWADITQVDNESPQELWNSYYSAIAAANHVIDTFKDNPEVAKAQLGEAYVCRAFNMYKLYEVFCKAYDPATASTDLGMPYPLKPETTIGVTYTRGTVAELMENIDKDLQKGLPLTSNEYTAPKFHFTQNAAYAFACRFYLNYRQYDKAIECATKVLGETPAASKLRDWRAWKSLSPNGQIQPNDFVDAKKNANLLLLPIGSQLGVYVGPYSTGMLYRPSNLLSTAETIDSKGPWGASNTALGIYKWYNSAFPGPFVRFIPYAFEYTDVAAGIGYAHSVIAELTTDRLLMERAEAKALSGDYQGAVDDINLEMNAFWLSGRKTLTLDQITSFYKALNYYTPTAPTAKKKFNTDIVTDQETQEPLLQCILHLTRLLTLHQGARMQYVKRYGIEIYRRSIDASSKVLEVSDTLKVNDLRRAIQLPQDVIIAGMEGNPRN